MSKIIVIGAGLAGSLLGIYLSRRGFEVEIYESRGDMRKTGAAGGRSINLALSDRGIAALRDVGMDEYMLREAVPMRGRMIHAPDGATKLLPYSGRQGEYINSISRAGLNIALMNEARKSGVKFRFNQKCVNFHSATGTAIVESTTTGGRRTIRGNVLIAADGAGSAVRNAMLNGGVPRFNFSQSWLEHGYKELHIPPGDDGGFLMEKNALHIWARRAFMMIALPNFDGSFTCTLFLAHKAETRPLGSVFSSEIGTLPNGRVSVGNGENSFEQLTDEKSLMRFFETNFADAIPLMPTLVEDFFANPIGNLGTIKCFPWNVGGKSLLLGDSAHAIVPFYGQGMNASFEDCRVLDSLIEKHGAEWETIFDEFTKERKPNTDAIADMAEENFYEMRDAVADPVFVRKRELETKLEQTFPDYFSKYSMVTFREDLPYTIAKQKGNAQDKLLMEISAKNEDVNKIDLKEVIQRLKLI